VSAVSLPTCVGEHVVDNAHTLCHCGALSWELCSAGTMFSLMPLLNQFRAVLADLHHLLARYTEQLLNNMHTPPICRASICLNWVLNWVNSASMPACRPASDSLTFHQEGPSWWKEGQPWSCNLLLQSRLSARGCAGMSAPIYYDLHVA